MGGFSHVDEDGKLKMVDVGPKQPQVRTAIAGGEIHLGDEVAGMIRENRMKKGDVLTAARLAGIQAAKRTSGLIPLCHPLALDWIDVRTKLDDEKVIVEAEARCTGKTGVEMEALTAASVALLTIYDMCKAAGKDMVIGNVRLLSKEKTDA